MPRYPVEVLWCDRGCSAGKDGWAFPRTVRNLIVAECAGMSILHFFGGKADFGVRMDIDLSVSPDVIGDAWLPPFAKDSFDCVVLDPPYVGEFQTLNNQKTKQFFTPPESVRKLQITYFERGSAIRYNRWIQQPHGLPFGPPVQEVN